MTDKTNLKKLIYWDCIRATWIPIGISVLDECLKGLLSVYTASILGSFADAVFRLDLSVGKANLVKLLFCLFVTILVIPALELFDNLIMLKYALWHDRIVLSRFLDKTYRSVIQCEAGNMQQRLEDDPCDMRKYLVWITESAVMAPVTLVFLLYNALSVSPLFTAIVFAVSLVKLIVPLAVRKLEQRYDRQNREYRSSVRTYENEITENPHTVRLYGLKDAFIRRLDTLYQVYYRDVQRKSIRCSQISGSISGFLDTFCTLVILFSGAGMAAAGFITPGAVAAMVGYFGVFGAIIGSVGTVIRKTPILRNIAERMLFFYEEREDVSGEEVDRFDVLSAEGVSFSYGETKILDGLCFQVHSGEKIAVTGPNGSGKSTLIKMICGLLRGDGLFVNGRDIRALSAESWREQFAYVPQEPLLFTGSVRENIALGRPGAAEGEITRIMEEVGIGYLAERRIGENSGSSSGSDLSGGERQKISIARALLKNTPILIFDEPSNHLDAETLRWLTEFIRSSDKTVLYISHEETLTSAADNRIRLRNL